MHRSEPKERPSWTFQHGYINVPNFVCRVCGSDMGYDYFRNPDAFTPDSGDYENVYVYACKNCSTAFLDPSKFTKNKENTAS